MAVASAIKFVQGATIGTPGVALLGALSTLVTASNGNDSDVVRWRWSMVAVPRGSAVPTGLISYGTIPTASWNPDVRGGYHVELEVEDLAGNRKKSRLVFLVPELSGRKIPAFDAEAAALNFGGQTKGWDPLIERYLKLVDGEAPLANSSTGVLNDVVTTVVSAEGNNEAVGSMRFSGAAPTLNGFANGYPGRVMLVYCVNATTAANEAGASTAANRIATSTGANVTLLANSISLFGYDGTASRWKLLASGSGGGTPGGSADEVQVNNGAGGFAGATNVKAGSSYVSIGTTVATAGEQRLANLFFIKRRNTGNTANETLFEGTSTDLWIGSKSDNTEFLTNLILNPFSTGYLRANNITQASWDANGMAVPGTRLKIDSGYLTFGTASIPTSGLVRLPYAATDTIIGAKDSGGTDRNVLSRPSADVIRLGDSAVRSFFSLGIDSQWISNTGEIVVQTSTTSQPITLAHGGALIKKANGTEYERVVSADVQTTDATVTTIATGTIASNTVVSVDVDVNGLRSTFAEAAGYKRIATFKNNGGTVSQIGTTTAVHTAEDVAGWDVTVDFTGTTWRVQVTGAAATTINWRVVVRVTVRN